MKSKICGRCKQEKPISEFFKSTRDGYGSYCKDCLKEYAKEYNQKTGYYTRYQREYQKKPEVRKRRNEKRAEYRQRIDIRIKNLARKYTNLAILRGELTREPCAFCGKEQGEAHHLDYNQPLLIVWLCSDCHRELHYTIKKGEIPK